MARLKWDAVLSLLLFGGSLAYRLVWNVGSIWTDPPDAVQYLKSGELLLSGHVVENTAMMPLYPLVIGLAGHTAIIPIEYVLNAFIAVVVYVLACRIFQSRLAGIVAGVLCCISPTLIFWSNFRLTETLFTLLLSLVLLAIAFRLQFATAVLMVLSILVRPTLDLIGPLMMLCAVPGRLSLRSAVRAISLYAVVYVVLMAPWWYHNWVKYHDFVRLDLAGGAVMALENNPEFEKTGLDFSKIFTALWQPYSGIGDPVKVDEAMKANAFHYIVNNPLTFIENSFDRLQRFYTPHLGINFHIDAVFTMFTAIVYLAAVTCVFRAGRQAQLGLMPSYLAILFLTAAHSATHALPRYRAPLEPLFYVLAGGGVALVVEGARRAILASRLVSARSDWTKSRAEDECRVAEEGRPT